MAKNIPFRLNRSSLVLALISAGFAGQAGAVAGRVEFVIGGATAQGADGRERPLSKGFELDKGDTVKTNDGRAQIRFTDGAYVSLQPNTEFAIKDYNYQGKTDGSERGLFALARGAMRTVTGFIGRINRNRYQITTPTATVGIRGTGGLIAVGGDGSTRIIGTSGIWTLTNPYGTLDVPAGTAGLAPSNPTQPPEQTDQPPSVGPTPPPPPPVFSEGEERTSTGDPASLCGIAGVVTGTCPTTTAPNPNPPLVSGSGYHVSYAYGTTGGSNANSSGTLANAVFDSAGMLTQFSASNSATLTSGTQSEFGTTGGVVAWGRWIGSFSVLEPTSPGPLSASSNQGFHYVVGLPASAIPTTGASATFTFLGATKPTGSDGSFAPGTFSGTMTVIFGSGVGTMNLTATLAFSGFAYNFTSGTATFGGGTAPFNGSMTGTASGTVPSNYVCSGGCTATVNGAFFGAGAAYAGYAYRMPTALGPTVTGVAVFKQ